MSEDLLLSTLLPDAYRLHSSGDLECDLSAINLITLGAITGALFGCDTSDAEINSGLLDDDHWLVDVFYDNNLLALHINGSDSYWCRPCDDDDGEDESEVFDAATVGDIIRGFLPPARTPRPKHRRVILLVRPVGKGPEGWPSEDGEFAFASIDPFDPPGWTLGKDSDHEIDSIELWEDTDSTLDEHIEMMKEEWFSEHGPEDGEVGDHDPGWEFRVCPGEETPSMTPEEVQEHIDQTKAAWEWMGKYGPPDEDED